MNKFEKKCDNCGKDSGKKKYCSNACKVSFFLKKEKKENPNNFTNQHNRSLVRKLYLIELRGGKCEKCGYNKNLAAIDFHHKNASEKKFELDSRKLSNTTLKDILLEFEKCLVLCANCHREIHHPKMNIDTVKDTLLQYDKFKKQQHLKVRQNKKNKPKCLDCGKEINYTYKRCVPCRGVFLRKIKDRPSKLTIEQSILEKGITKTAEVFNVSRTTIKRWLK